MRVGFRTDASVQMGTGHVMRCLTLADALREYGARSVFFCRPHVGQLMELIAQRGHEVVALPAVDGLFVPSAMAPAHAAWLGTDWATDAEETGQALGDEVLDWMVVDHYALDHHWEKSLRSRCQRLMVIDDLADRLHDCNVLLDQNLGRSVEHYRHLVPGGATLLIGPQFALLRPEFVARRPASLARRAQPMLRRLLITMGGVDKDNMTGQVLEVLEACRLPENAEITVVMGHKAPWLDQVKTQAVSMSRKTQVLVGVTDMAWVMMQSDLAIGAAGGASWERCCLGLPTLILVLADNQRAGAAALQNAGAAVAVEHAADIELLINGFLQPVDGSERLHCMSLAAERVTDGGGVNRVCEHLVVGHA